MCILSMKQKGGMVVKDVPAEFAEDSGNLPEIAGGVLTTARIWIWDGIAEGYFHPSGDPEAKKSYRGLDDLLVGIDELADHQDRPRREKLRHIPGVCKKTYQPAYLPDDRPGYTVSIRIYFRQHCSMQGELCLQGSQRVCFRSGLELLVLLQQVVEQIMGKEEIRKQLHNT